jgi:tRNA G26 N,N-dimethylase Trm1
MHGYKNKHKAKALSVSVKLETIQKVDAEPYVTCTKFAEELSIPVSMLNHITSNMKNTTQQCVTTHPSRNKLKTSEN